MRVSDIPGVADLSTPEKLLLVEELWESISSDGQQLAVPESHRDELDARLERLRAGQGELLSLSELQRRVQARR